MKKILMTLAAAFCCAMTTTVFTACGSDDDDNNNKKPVDAPTSGEMECTLYTSDESLASFDFYVKYYDESGKIQSEKVVWSDQTTNQDDLILRTWTKKVVAKLPATLGILFEVKAKDGLDPNGQYILSRGYNITFSSKTASGNTIETSIPNKNYVSGRNKVGMLEEMLKENSRPLDIIYKFDVNGKGTGPSKWE